MQAARNLGIGATAAVMVAFALAPGASAADLWTDDGRIVYVSCPMSTCDIHSSKADGSDEAPLFLSAEFEDTPTISDNGKRVAFRRGGDIWVSKANGNNLENITNTPGVSEDEPDISPDGQSIVYTSRNGPTGDIVRSKIDGSDVKTVLDSAKDDSSPEWSPDGKRIAFDRNDSSVTDVYTVKKDGSSREQVTDTENRSETQPTWSPDGKRIAMSQSFSGGSRLKTYKASGGSP